MTDSQEITIGIDALAHDGRGMGFLPGIGKGKAVFVANALPGETALARIQKDKGKFLEAVCLRILDHGTNRAQALCQHGDVCGACALQRMPYHTQLFWKEDLAKQALGRIGGLASEEIETAWRPIVPSPEITGFRNKLSLAFGYDSQGNMVLGFRKRASHEVFSLKDCVLGNCADIVKYMEQAATASGLAACAENRGFWKNLVLRQSGDEQGGWLAILLTAPASGRERRLMAALGRELLAAIPQCRGFIHEEAGKKENRRTLCLDGEGSVNPAVATLRFALGGRDFCVDASSFFQVNTRAAEKLADLAFNMNEQIPRQGRLIDLYCGSGAPGLLLGRDYDSPLGIELDRAAIECARKNAGDGTRWKFLQGDTGHMLKRKEAGGKWATALLDPPRAGLDQAVTGWLAAAKPDNIIYISCNPATFARDIKRLSTTYRLRSIGTVDLFPHTPHVECCALLEKKSC